MTWRGETSGATFLKADGSGKADLPKPEQREFIGPRQGLYDPLPDTPLIVAEGIESAASAVALFGFPAWAALCDTEIAALELPR